tara:strand:- start:6245 stop:8191 length:1947 start_codon:yes stop_codon:yes gene_type:complete
VTRNIVVGTAGHIDHGKSALVHALTGSDPDRLKEEKARGITIDLGFAHLRQGETQLAFVDVPGHERFIKNMLAGVSGIDGVLLVVAADESVMPQTREHFDICRLLHITSGVVALTKIDLVDRETVELVRLETADLLAGSFLAQGAVVPVSAKTGEGLEELRTKLFAMARHVSGRTPGGAVRLPVDRAFTVKGFGTVVTGTLVSGKMAVEDTLRALPAGRDIKVRGLQVHGTVEPVATAGQRVAVNLSGIGVAELSRGQTAVTPGCFKETQRLDAVLDLLGSVRSLRHGARVRFHQGTSEVLGRVVLGRAVEGQADLGEAPDFLPAGTRAFVRLRLEQPSVITRGDCFILRSYSPSLTIAGGRVLDPDPPRVGIRTTTARERMEVLLEGLTRDEAEFEDRAVSIFVREQGLAGFPIGDLTPRAGVQTELSEALVKRLVSSGGCRRIGDTLVDAVAINDVGARLISMLGRFHASQPLQAGLPREEARERLFHHAGTGVFEAVLEDLVKQDRLLIRDYLALSSHRVSLSPEEMRVSEDILSLLGSAGLRPPTPAEMRERLQIEESILDRVMELLVRQGRVVRVGSLIFDLDAVESLKKDLSALKNDVEPVKIDVGIFKDRYGISRKFAIPLLEYLDRERVTRRVGRERILL